MNTHIREITCKSIELDGFGSPAADAWFDRHTAPMDGEEETGAHTYQAAALKAYLKGDSKPSETAVAITKPHAFEKKADLRSRALGIIEDALFELLESHTLALVDLLNFGNSWSDGWKQSHWRKALATRDPATRAKRYETHVHLAFVEATCEMAAPGPNAEDGLLPLSWGYEWILEALEFQDAVWDFEVPAAAVWIKVAGERFREGAKKGEKSWELEREGRLWTEGPMSMDRWNFWLKRFEEIEKIGEVISTTASEGVQDARAQGFECQSFSQTVGKAYGLSWTQN
ncbi:uncharacterized protein N7498_007938 [Penicillium cinerascens]|uniref:Uncharacterized protein n=1 Tax=Penicillium cinerascens TaxID=70096 RepID=A0A9W9M9Q6_9EURO|nr:uncharacterized protein N7498_007938 [Penicillium cinerascens]KAJ5194500.1 hypothetical protein N7498_007938 [Penicillium cinerascens]